MSSEAEDRILRKTYSEIINGFSITKYQDKDIFIKHFSSADNLEIDYLYTIYYEEALSRGLPTEEERIEFLKKDRLWDVEKDKQIGILEDSLKNLYNMKRKSFRRADVENANRQIEESTNLLNKILADKDHAVGNTAEKVARRRVDTYFISKSFFADRELKNLLFPQEAFDDLDKNELEKLYDIFYTSSAHLQERKIKTIAVKEFFMNVFSLASNIYEFYGKPVCYLTFYQIQLSAFGNFYKSILTGDPRPPAEIIGDPEKLEDWYYGRANAEELLKKVGKDGEGATLVGLTKADRKFLGLENPERVSVQEYLIKGGGEISMEELMKIEGV